jgi:transcriptional regulator with XRE-family HTH domain
MLRRLRDSTGLSLRQVATLCTISSSRLKAMEDNTARPFAPEHPAYVTLAVLYAYPLQDLQHWARIQRKRWEAADLLRQVVRDADIHASAYLARRVLLCSDPAQLSKILAALD